MTTTEEQEFARELATYHGGLVVARPDGSYDAEASAELRAWLAEHYA
jgi:hypothetical protein